MREDAARRPAIERQWPDQVQSHSQHDEATEEEKEARTLREDASRRPAIERQWPDQVPDHATGNGAEAESGERPAA